MAEATTAKGDLAKGDPAKDKPLVRLLKANPPAAAGILMGLFVVPPLSILILAMPDGWDGWCTSSVAIMGAAVVPALGTLLRLSWANAAGQYLCWAELVQVALRIMTVGFKPVLALPAGVAGVALLVLTSAQPATASPAARERAPDSLGLWVKENIEAIIVAFIMALVIRCFCIEVFKIPSSSMEPTLLGDLSSQHVRDSCPFKDEHKHPGGDRIMVTKYYFALSPIERYDVVVFKFPLNQAKNFIKRVVGLPDEHLKVYHGNIFVKRRGDGEFRIARRSLRTQDSIWIPVDDGFDYLGDKDRFESKWTVKPPANGERAEFAIDHRELATVEKGGARSIRFVRSKDLRIDDGHGQDVGELQLAFDFELTSSHGSIFAEIVNEYGKFETQLSIDGESALKFHGPERKQHVSLPGVKLSTDRRYHFALSVYDGAVTVRLNGEVLGHHSFIEERKDVTLIESPERLVAFGASDVTFKVRNLTLGRDIFYKGKRPIDRKNIEEDKEVYIDPGHYVMMGDNVENSHDARSWSKAVYTLTDGRKVVFEEQERSSYDSAKAREVQEKYGLRTEPDIVLKADEYGNEWALYREKDPGDVAGKPYAGVIKDEQTGIPFFRVEEKFIVGKALWIWWPQGRWFRLIR